MSAEAIDSTADPPTAKEGVFALKRLNQILGIRVGHSEHSAVECCVCDQQEIDRLLG